jgi:hypothetical protein
MALYDQRTFKQGDTWWVAEVHTAAGAGIGLGRPQLFFERVFFTNLSDPDAPSRSIRIPAGLLNQLSHRSMGELLKAASPMEGRFDMSPRNAPDADELAQLEQIRDADGLTWVYRVKNSPAWSPDGIELRPVLDFICLDDSALHGTISFNSMETLDHFQHIHGRSGIASLLPSVTQNLRDWMPPGNPESDLDAY